MKSYSKYFSQIDELVGQHEYSVAAFYHKNFQVPRGTAAANGFGSGFLITHPKGVVLATAEHVAREAAKEKIVFLRIGNQMLSLEKQNFVVERSIDVAVSLFTFEQLEREGVGALSPIKLESRTRLGVSSGAYAVIGCPSSRQKLDQRFRRKYSTAHSMTLTAAKIDRFDGTDIPAPLLLDYDPDEMLIGANMPADGKPFDLHGMSGGPVFEIFASPKRTAEAEPTLQLSFTLAGLAVEWHAANRLVVATRVELLGRLMTYL